MKGLKNLRGVLLFALVFSCVFVALDNRASAALSVKETHTPGPGTNRPICTAMVPVDFSAYIDNVSLNTSTGVLSYDVGIGWRSCIGDPNATRAYAIYGTPDICPLSGWYATAGADAYDCVKYIGSPAYTGPGNQLTCPWGSNASCVTPIFGGARRAEQGPGAGLVAIRMTKTIPNWSTVMATDGAYSISGNLCQFYKTGVNFTDYHDDRCLTLSLSVTWTVAQPWSVNVSSSCDIEAGTVTFSASKSGSGSADGVVISRSITMQNPSRSISIPNITLNNGDFPWSQTYTISPAPVPGQSIQAGSISATPSSGGGATSTSPSGSCTSPAKHLKPYLKAYGGEVLSGGGFNVGGTCTVPSPTSPAPIGGFGSVQAFTSQNGSGQYVGSSSQLTVSSLLQVNEFYSNSQAGNTSPKSLTIANTGTAEGNSTYGGGSKNTQCITDYYNTTQDPSISSAITNFGSALTGAPGRKQYTVSGDLTIGTGVIPRNHQIAVYVDGDVFINGNISYQTGASNISELPNLYIIAKGNIYIDNDVTNIDGTFIAQTDGPDVNDKGNIYTCTDSNATLFPAAKLATACDKQLVVNGGLIAQEVRFLRTAGSIDTSTSSVETPSYSNGTGTGAAEVINYTPEVYLAPSPLRNPNATNTNTGSAGAGRYDAIKSLPPIY